MGEDDKREIKTKVNAKVEKKSEVYGFGKYVVDNILVPGLEDMVHDALSNTITAVGNTAQGFLNQYFNKPTNTRISRNGQTNYNGCYTRQQNNMVTTVQPANVPRTNTQPIGRRSSKQIEYIYVQTKEEAEAIVNGLYDLINNYGNAKVRDLYEMMNPSPAISFQDSKWGWERGATFTYRPVHTGEYRGWFFVDIPEPIEIHV